MEEYYWLRYGRLRSDGPGLGNFENRRIEIEKQIHYSQPADKAIRELVREADRAAAAAADEEEKIIEKQIERDNQREKLVSLQANMQLLKNEKVQAEAHARQCAAAIMQLEKQIDESDLDQHPHPHAQDPGGPEKTGQP